MDYLNQNLIEHFIDHLDLFEILYFQKATHCAGERIQKRIQNEIENIFAKVSIHTKSANSFMHGSRNTVIFHHNNYTGSSGIIPRIDINDFTVDRGGRLLYQNCIALFQFGPIDAHFLRKRNGLTYDEYHYTPRHDTHVKQRVMCKLIRLIKWVVDCNFTSQFPNIRIQQKGIEVFGQNGDKFQGFNPSKHQIKNVLLTLRKIHHKNDDYLCTKAVQLLCEKKDNKYYDFGATFELG